MPSRVPAALRGPVSRRSILRTAAAGAAAGIAGGSLGARARQATPVAGGDAAAAIGQFAAEARETYGVPGVAVAVVHQGEVVLAEGYGVRSAEADGAVDADTIFQLASNTKPMTAFTFGTFVDEGAAAWDTLASEVVADLRLMDAYATLHVTPRDLLAHRSGLPGFYGDVLGRLGYDRAEILRRLRYVEPGSSFRDVAAYSNLGYFIVGEMIARLTGAPWEEAMQARLFTPTGMTRSGPSVGAIAGEANMSANHARVDGALETVPLDPHGEIGAAGSAYSTAADMGRWMAMLLAGGEADGTRVMGAETVRQLFDPVIPAEVSFTEAPPISPTAGFSYGLGWGNFHWHGHEVLEKGGALAGVRTVVNMVPSLGFGVAVLANLNLTYLPEAIRAFALEQVLGAAEEDMQADIFAMGAQIDAAFSARPEAPTDAPPLPVPLEDLAGTYAQDLHGPIEIVVDGDGLRFEGGPAGLPATLTHLGATTFLLDWGTVTNLPEPVTFVLGPDGVATELQTESLGRFTREA